MCRYVSAQGPQDCAKFGVIVISASMCKNAKSDIFCAVNLTRKPGWMENLKIVIERAFAPHN